MHKPENTAAAEQKKPPEKAPQPKSLWQFFRESPLVGLELEFERNKDTSRDIDLFDSNSDEEAPSK